MKRKKKVCRKSSRATKGRTSDERLLKDVEKILARRGEKALEIVKREVLEEKIECEEAREALHYFITKYWHDLARPTLLSLCCEAVGGNPDATIPFAVSLSLISGALDIHDDIIDQSKTKYGRPTVYGKYGKEIALLTADALLFKGFALLQKACMQIPDEKAAKIIDIVKNMFYELGDAEAMELHLRGRLDVTPEEYLHTIEKKAAHIEAYARIGAILGNATEIEQENFGTYGKLLGIASIIRDEIIDMFDTREARHRIKKEHLPLPLVYSLEKYGDKSSAISCFKKKSVKDLIKENSIMSGLEQTRKYMTRILRYAYRYLKNIKNLSIKNQLIKLIDSLIIDLEPPTENS